MNKKRRALTVGINYYKDAPPLHGCVNDARRVGELLERHENRVKNFHVDQLLGENYQTRVTRRALMDSLDELFAKKYDDVVFYYSGHGSITSTGGYLLTSEVEDGDEGVSMTALMQLANDSPSTNIIIILDCCHSGYTGNVSRKDDKAPLNHGITILAASGKNESAIEMNGSGIFTTLLCDALEGGAANLLGEVTPGSIYSHIDQSLAANEQRPLFKSHVDSFISLRHVKPPIRLSDLHEIVALFPDKNDDFQLDPSFEPKRDPPITVPPDAENNRKFAILQKYNRLHMVVPNEEEHMYYAAVNKKSCKLTVLGKHYWNLVNKGII